MRKAKLHRKTAETEIRIALTIEGRGKYEVSTGIRFLDHMLELFTRHGGFDLKLAATGDLDVDQHHTVEDVGIALGEVFDRALGDRRGILRAGYFVMPMDETLGLSAVDFGGRAAAVVDTKVRATLGGRSSCGIGARFLRGLCARRARQCSCARALRTLQPPQDRSALQSFRTGPARGVFPRPPAGPHAPKHQRTSMIAIVDYGAGNLNSVKKAFDYLGAEVVVTDQPATVASADKIVLPGVGHFSSLQALNRTGLREVLLQSASAGKPFLGICLGMQWLFEGSEECSELAGAGIFPGKCRQFPASVKSPHVGWNSLAVQEGSRLLRGIAQDSFVYYTHSFHAPVVCCNDGSQRIRTAVCRRRRARQHFRSAVPSRKIRRRGTLDPEEFLRGLMC